LVNIANLCDKYETIVKSMSQKFQIAGILIKMAASNAVVYKCSYLEGAVIWLVGLGAPSALCSPGSSSLSEPPDELLSEATRGAFCSGLPSHPPVAEPLLATEKKKYTFRYQTAKCQPSSKFS